MILTVTINPSIDYLYHCKHFQLGKTNKMKNPNKSIGGKGINAGRAAKTMGSDVILTGFLCGKNGQYIKSSLKNENFFDLNFIEKTDNESRNAISIMHDNDTHTEITENGPSLQDNDKLEITNKILNILQEHNINIICISGSVNSEDTMFYSDIITIIQSNFPNIKIIVDISGIQLKNVLNNNDIQTFMCKPNIHEFNDINQTNCKTKQDVINELKITNSFINNDVTIISCGGDGAIVQYKDDIYNVDIPKITVVNPTGAGDSTIGGFASSLEKNVNVFTAVKYAMACGISNTKHKSVGHIDKHDVETIVNEISIDKIITL